MKLIVKTVFEQYNKVVDEPDFIPRVGDRIEVGFRPAPVVKDVVINYSEGWVLVDCS